MGFMGNINCQSLNYIELIPYVHYISIIKVVVLFSKVDEAFDDWKISVSEAFLSS